MIGCTYTNCSNETTNCKSLLHVRRPLTYCTGNLRSDEASMNQCVCVCMYTRQCVGVTNASGFCLQKHGTPPNRYVRHTNSMYCGQWTNYPWNPLLAGSPARVVSGSMSKVSMCVMQEGGSTNRSTRNKSKLKKVYTNLHLINSAWRQITKCLSFGIWMHVHKHTVCIKTHSLYLPTYFR
jgi:hypothetical protein